MTKNPWIKTGLDLDTEPTPPIISCARLAMQSGGSWMIVDETGTCLVPGVFLFYFMKAMQSMNNKQREEQQQQHQEYVWNKSNRKPWYQGVDILLHTELAWAESPLQTSLLLTFNIYFPSLYSYHTSSLAKLYAQYHIKSL
ncbi:hypothetical protein BCR42DRAFT_397363 [Absidia repens]|uniref:Uncharacterized protein n=1 Tax=Absidia repens TaxID=90262 RepID=A0A1X2I1U1_9FUNG|nr:hypothetical protein BCR42DRAFT_397363 [Absidia repens]